MERGRPKNIESPKQMWDLFCEYRDAIKQSPIFVRDWVGAGAMQVERPKEKPLTYEGFSNFVFEKGVINDTDDYFANTNNSYSDFSEVCSRIKRCIRQDQIEGGMAGIYNPSITQRLNNLAETTNGKLEIKEVNVTYDR